MESQVSEQVVTSFVNEFDDYETETMTYVSWKRAFDLIASFFLILLAFPILILVGLAVKIESPKGPIFADAPKRIGKNKKEFFLYKFRSMIPGAHEMIRKPEFGNLFQEYKKNNYKLEEDFRVTKVGKFIRKFSLDELPQLINVLKGDMSLVGPRPYFAYELNEFLIYSPTLKAKKEVELISMIKPGITGLWQVSGRSNVSFEQRVRIDADYARNISFWLDLKILLKTPFVALFGKGAF